MKLSNHYFSYRIFESGKSLFLFMCLALFSAATSASAQKPEPAKAQTAEVKQKGQVLVILASDKDAGMDPALASITALKRPPFNAFKSMKVLSKENIHLSSKKAVQTKLPNKRKLKIQLEKLLKDGRYQVNVSINQPGKADYLPLLKVKASQGKPFFVAGQKHLGGTLIIGVIIGEKSK